MTTLDKALFFGKSQGMQFQQEPVEHVYDEMIPLLRMNFHETAPDTEIPLNPQRERFIAMDRGGHYKLFTARGADGKLVGYCGLYVHESLHYHPSLQASQDLIFIDPRFRGFGKEFIKWIDAELTKIGVQLVYQHVSVKFDWSPILERIGYQKTETVYSRRLA